jgi:tetratricopeptide (TPR) repeat protein
VTRASSVFLTLLLAACSNVGTLIDRLPENAAAQGYVLVSKPVTLPKSRLSSDCGPEAVCAVINYWGKPATVEEISMLVRDPKVTGIFSADLPHLARQKGLKPTLLAGNAGQIKKSVDRDVPPIIMVSGRTGEFHYFVVSGYNDKELLIVCEEYDQTKRLISYDELESLWGPADHVMLELELSNAESDYLGGANLESEGLFAEAIQFYKRALGIDPEHYETRVGLGNCLLAQGKMSEALEEYRRAFKTNSTDPRVCNNLANIYIELKSELKEAERLAGISVDQFDAAYRHAREEVDRETVQAIRSIKQRELSRTELDLAHALGTLGQARAANGEHSQAVAAWQASFDHFPLTEFDSRAKRLYEMALSYRQVSMPAQARTCLKDSLELARDSALRSKIEDALKE